MAERVDDHRHRRGELSPAWIVEVIAGKWRAPVVKHEPEASVGDVVADEVFRDIGDPETACRSLDHGNGRIEGELAFHPHTKVAAIPGELPGIQSAERRLPHIDAVMIDQVLG